MTEPDTSLSDGPALHRPNDATERRPLLAALSAGLVVFLFGLGYRALAARLAAPVAAAPVAPDDLDRFPRQLSGWDGQDAPLDPAIVRGTGTDGHINRRYSRPGGQSILLYVAYGARVDDVLSHQPEGCYRAAGWTLANCRSVRLPLPDGAQLPCRVFRCSRGGLNTQRLAVLHYLIVDGRLCGDISLLRSRVWRVFAWAHYVAQVQIVASTEIPLDDRAMELVRAFAADSASEIARLFPSGVPEPTAKETGEKVACATPATDSRI